MEGGRVTGVLRLDSDSFARKRNLITIMPVTTL
jgi:hypothetical protein